MSVALSPGGYVRQGGNRSGSAPRAVNVQVAVRCRPLNSRERSAGERSLLKCNSGSREVHCVPPVNSGAVSKSSAAVAGRKTYTYDHVFGPEASQEDVYNGVVEPIVDEVLQGYNCTVFAYGQTGTGKTHTMEGRRDDDVLCMAERRLPENAGIIPRSVKQIFDHLRSITDEHSVRVSHLELYNEQLTDLLGPEMDMQAVADSGLRVYDDSTKGTFVQGLDEVLVRSEEEIFAVLDKSAIKRRTAETLMNKYSSRSHSVFTITIHIKESTPDGADLLKVGKLNLVDLAGSENVGRSGAVRGRAREAGNINQSLLTLGRVITALVEKHPHVPYRDSKLTRLLQESLGGRNKTCVIATVTPGSSSTEETASTLDYAHRAKSIKNRPTVNQMIAKHVLLKEYTEEISKIKRELEASRSKNGVYLPPEEFERLQATSKHQKEWITRLESRSEEVEQQNTVLKDKLTRTQSALARTMKDLEETRIALTSTENELQSTTSKLAVASQQRDESNYLLGAHISAEVQLHAQAKELTSTADRAVADLGALHTRMDARVAAEGANVSALAQLQSNIAHSLKGADTRIQEFQSVQDKSLSSCQEATSSLVSGVANRVTEATSELATMCANVRRLCDEQMANAASSEDDAAMENAQYFKDFNARVDRQADLAVKIRDTLESSSAELGVSLSAIGTDMQQLYSISEASVTAQAKALANFAVSQEELLENNRAALEEQFRQQLEEIATADEAVSVAVAEQKAAVRSAKESALDEITKVLSTLVTTSDETGAGVTAAVKMQSTALQSCVAAARSSADDQIVVGRKVAADARANSEAAKQQSLNQASAQLSVAMDRSKSTGEVMVQRLTQCAESVSDFAAGEEAHRRALESQDSTMVSQRRAREAFWQSSTGAQTDTLDTETENVSLMLRNSRSDAEKDGALVSSAIVNIAGTSASFTSSLASDLGTGVGSSVASFALATDKLAATAPPKRTWEYPQSLTTAAPHVDMIKSYRDERGLEEVPLAEDLPPRVVSSENGEPCSSEDRSIADPESLHTGSSDMCLTRVSDDTLSVGTAEDSTMTEGETTAVEKESMPVPDKGESSDNSDEKAEADILRDMTNLPASGVRDSLPEKPTVNKPAEGVAEVAAAAPKRSGLRPITRRATSRRRAQ